MQLLYMWLLLQGEMNAADLLKQMMISIDIPKPPSDVTTSLLIDRVTDKVSVLLHVNKF